MNRFLPAAALCCAALAGCVRQESADLRSMAPRSTAAAPAAAAPAIQPSAPEQTGSRLLPPPEALSDAVITAHVKANILADPALRGTDISVNTTHGVVNLTGLVASQEQAAVASGHAQHQDGVMRVDSHLSVDLR
jgi:hyperosmotically inducible periplasmic protein